jgi:hypothetical protein
MWLTSLNKRVTTTISIDTIVFPTEFWGNNLFREKPKNRLYAGFASPASQKLLCNKYERRCLTSKQHTKSMMKRFVLLSKDLVRFVADSNPYHVNPELTPSKTVEMAVASVLYNRLTGNLRLLNLVGILPTTRKITAKSPPGGVRDTLECFDKYKDVLITYKDPKEVLALVEASPAKVGIGEHP